MANSMSPSRPATTWWRLRSETERMKPRTASRLALAFITGTVIAASMTLYTGVEAQQAGAAPGNTVAIDADDIGGIVTSAKGPEAGVWVIAETTETPTRFARMVVTDDRGRYLVPDLPKANFQVF